MEGILFGEEIVMSFGQRDINYSEEDIKYK